jgi:hypothetical protein
VTALLRLPWADTLLRIAAMSAMLAWQGSAWASCSVVTAPTAAPGAGYWSRVAGSARARLNSRPMTAMFAFQCDRDSNYSISLRETGNAPKGFTDMVSNDGTRIRVQVILRSIGETTINSPFSVLPSAGYEGRAVARRTYNVALDLVPSADIKVSGNVRGGTFNGAAMVEIGY